jgi:hypothetical protein
MLARLLSAFDSVVVSVAVSVAEVGRWGFASGLAHWEDAATQDAGEKFVLQRLVPLGRARRAQSAGVECRGRHGQLRWDVSAQE